MAKGRQQGQGGVAAAQRRRQALGQRHLLQSWALGARYEVGDRARRGPGARPAAGQEACARDRRDSPPWTRRPHQARQVQTARARPEASSPSRHRARPLANQRLSGPALL